MITLDGFVDTYYAYDFKQPHHNERLYTTQPQRHNEPSINLAYLSAELKSERIRGRLALQAGNSVKANYAAEANPELGHIQESYFGLKLADKTWLDGGIYFSHIGAESWISKNNYTYTRSLIADYSPYYTTGLRLQHELDSKTSLEIHLINGWQIISETNSGKSLGFQIKHKLDKDHALTYNLFLGDENVLPEDRPRFRQFHEFIWEQTINSTWQLTFSFDIGSQTQQNESGLDVWSGSALVMRQKLNTKHFLAYRVEYYSDPHDVNSATNSTHGFQVTSVSINYDHYLHQDIVWRTEFRTYQSRDKIYPLNNKQDFSFTDEFLVTSLALNF